MTLEQMRAFARVAELGSFTKAAKVLNAHASRTSALVKELERELGQDLLVRSTRAVRLTPMGSEFLARIKAILAAAEDLQRAAKSASGKDGGHLRITAAADIGLIAAFVAANPDMRLTVTYAIENLDLVARDFDLALRFGPLKDSNLRSKKLGQLSFGLFAAPGYLAARQRPRNPGDLQAMDILRLALAPQKPLSFRWQGREASIGREPRLTCSDVGGLRDACLQGLGLAQLSTLVAAPWLKAGMLEQVLPDAEFPEATLFGVYASAGQVQPVVKRFIDFAKKELNKTP